MTIQANFRNSLGLALSIGVSAMSGCNKPKTTEAEGTAAPTAAPSASAQVGASGAASAPAKWPVPTGIGLNIQPKKGVGPIRFGATVATVERLMERECEVKTENICGYNGRAVDFHFEEGSLSEIRIHRSFRPNKYLPGASYGVFNGGFQNGARLELLRQVSEEMFGVPSRREDVDGSSPWLTVERHYYDDLVLEFDRLDSGKLVLGGVILKKPHSK